MGYIVIFESQSIPSPYPVQKMYKIAFKLRTANINKTTGEAPVSVKYIYEDTERLFAASVSCKPKDFDVKKGLVKSSDSFSAEKNEQIARVVACVERAVREAREYGGVITGAQVVHAYKYLAKAEEQLNNELVPAFRDALNTGVDVVNARIAWLKNELAMEEKKLHVLLTEGNRVAGQPEGIDANVKLDLFTNRITEFVARREAIYTAGTKRMYMNLSKLVKEFNSNLDITEVNLKVLNSFQIWLVKVKGRKNGTVNTYVTNFKAILNEFADELGINLAFYKKFKPMADLANENIIILTAEEIQEIEEMDVSRWKVKSAVREQFVFCHETGLRHSDLNKVVLGAVEDMPAGDGHHIGHKRLRIATKKGKKQIIVPLTQKALDILERNNFSFQFYELRNYNQALESIARCCKTLQYDFTRTHYSGSEEIQETKKKCEFVQSHAGRRTFINNALLKGVSESTVATWVGHADVAMIQKHYSHREVQAQAEAHKILV